ncbi:MAG TPA: polysaccharide deacetylase family protein [Candidatus Eisenbacteria bacterium]|nr:polysaccharide deacetylase family protein [Candidatus Eisenbacteria bacterium]
MKRKKSPPRNTVFRFVFFSSTVFLFLTAIFLSGYFFITHASPTYPTSSYEIDEYYQPTDMHHVLGSNTDETIATHGSRDEKEIALTFDADMTPGMQHMLITGSVKSFYDADLISYLEKTHTKATLFMTGLWIESYPKEAKELGKNRLFELASHSYSHGGFSGSCYGLTPIPDEDDIGEILKTQTDLEKIAGVKGKLFRFPGGCYDDYDLKVLSNLGITPVQWDVVAHDGFNPSLEQLENNVLPNVQNGSIIVMHMNGYPNEPETKNAVERIVPELKKKGYHFVKVSELLNP